jgi:hypothetical protein
LSILHLFDINKTLFKKEKREKKKKKREKRNGKIKNMQIKNMPLLSPPFFLPHNGSLKVSRKPLEVTCGPRSVKSLVNAFFF